MCNNLASCLDTEEGGQDVASVLTCLGVYLYVCVCVLCVFVIVCLCAHKLYIKLHQVEIQEREAKMPSGALH